MISCITVINIAFRNVKLSKVRQAGLNGIKKKKFQPIILNLNQMNA